MSEPPSFPTKSVSALAIGGRAIFWAQLVKFIIRLGSAALLARLLTPDDYGLFGMAGVIYGLLYMVRDFGIVSALQQPGDVGARFRSLRRLGWMGGIVIAASGALAGWPAQWLYGEPRLPAVLAAMSLGLGLGSWSAPATGLLYRQQRLARLAGIEVGAMSLGITVALFAAAHGLGVWALVLMGLVNEFVAAVATWAACGRPPPPTAGGKNPAWRDVLGFSGRLTAHSIAGYFARTGDQAVVGWAAGAAPLGIYNRGAQIAALPMQLVIAPFTGWMVASLARLRPDVPGYTAFFQRGLNGFLHLSVATAALSLAAPDLVVHAFFGERWMASVPVVKWLAPGFAVQPLIFAQIWLLESTGQVRQLLRLSLLGMGLVLGACLLASSHGINAVAQAASLGAILRGGAGLSLCLPFTVVRGRDILAALQGPLLSHGGWALLVMLLRPGLQLEPGAPGWGMLVAGSAVYYGLFMAASPRLRREILGHFLLKP